MGSLDVDSLFINITLEENIEILQIIFLKNLKLLKAYTNLSLRSLCLWLLKIRILVFDKQFLNNGSTLVNAFLLYHEKNLLERCPLRYRLFYYQKYVDDIFALFNSLEHLKPLQGYLNSRYVNISFTIQNEKPAYKMFQDLSRLD